MGDSPSISARNEAEGMMDTQGVDDAAAALDLANLLKARQADIVSSWAEIAARLPASRYRASQPDDLEALAAGILVAVLGQLGPEPNAGSESRLAERAFERLRLAFDPGEIVEFTLLLKEAALPFILAALPPGSPQAGPAITQLDASVRRLMRQQGQRYGRLTERNLWEQQQRTSLMLRAVRTVSDPAQLDQTLKQIVEGIRAAVGVHHCGVFLLDAEGNLMSHAATENLIRERCQGQHFRRMSPVARTLFQEVMEARKPAICDDARYDPRANREAAEHLGVRSILGVPMEAAGRQLGVVVIATLDETHAFTAEEVELVWGIAHLLALALENARLYDETQRQLAESQSLQRVTAALLQELSLEEVLEIVCAEAQWLTGAAESAVCLLGGERERCLRVTLNREAEAPVFEHVSGSRCATCLMMQGREPLLIDNPGDEFQEYYPRTELTSLLAVPLCLRGSASGALTVINKPAGFREADLRVMRLFSDQAAVAIENAQLYRQVGQLAANEERQRLARELHDSVTHDLYSITLYAEAATRLLASGKTGAVAGQLQEVRATGQEALRQMRLLIFELRPPVLEQEGLVAALRARLGAVEARAGIQTELRVSGERRLPPALEEAAYRVLQETLNNVVKHARATRVTLDLQFDDETLRAEVRDDGVGFDPAAARQGGGLGLEGIEERLQRMGGSFEIESAPGQGTKVRVQMDAGRVLPSKAAPASLPRMLTLPGPDVRPLPQASIRVLIADDHAIVRKGIRALLETQAGVEVVGEASNGQETVERVEELQPDVVLMDLLMPGMDGIEATRRIVARHPGVRILVLTSFASDEKVFPAIRAGALGYLLKDSGPEDLLQAIQCVYLGQSSLDPVVARKVLRELSQPSDRSPAPESLSEREREVLCLMGQSLSNRQIADKLVITPATVRSHVSNILSKLHLDNRPQAVLYALREGLASLDDAAGRVEG
jgi:signal transduction histidine kinase/DNA-binding NarL/FixJ family response regulator